MQAGFLSHSRIIKHHTPKLERMNYTQKIKKIILHRTVNSSAQSTFNSFNRGSKPYGTHFVVDKDGKIYQTANLNANSYSVGIEVVGMPLDKNGKPTEKENEAHVLRFLSYGLNNIDTPLLTLLNDIKADKITEKNDTGNTFIDQYLNMLGGLIKNYYPKGERVVLNTDPAYEKYRMLAKVDYVSPRFYTAKNPQHFDANILNPRDKPADGIYHA
ncbi:peptidoglycan recognition family protein [Psychrobacter sp. Ps7]|uniref:peptidoglycan recognition protein family protein n=1 Tax=Psychrobacter sp. Ps7 TaxID=2790961 RepID=UPI001EE14211|nr:peptidoglycan recognition family protein [Psychrobacter sp. Ps7]MCG3873887.1 N-acetylmuramoyl-L-alanine amidase [Psychrobacter sp. Ps7]